MTWWEALVWCWLSFLFGFGLGIFWVLYRVVHPKVKVQRW